MDQGQKEMLRINHKRLVEGIDQITIILDHLYTEKIFSQNVQQKILREKDPLEQNRMLLYHLKKRPPSDYDKFALILCQTDNEHMADLLVPGISSRTRPLVPLHVSSSVDSDLHSVDRNSSTTPDKQDESSILAMGEDFIDDDPKPEYSLPKAERQRPPKSRDRGDGPAGELVVSYTEESPTPDLSIPELPDDGDSRSTNLELVALQILTYPDDTIALPGDPGEDNSSSFARPEPSAPMIEISPPPPPWYSPEQFDAVIFHSVKDSSMALSICGQLKDAGVAVERNFDITTFNDSLCAGDSLTKAATGLLELSNYWLFLVTENFLEDPFMELVHDDALWNQVANQPDLKRCRVPVYTSEDLRYKVPFLRGLQGIMFDPTADGAGLDNHSKKLIVKSFIQDTGKKAWRQAEMDRRFESYREKQLSIAMSRISLDDSSLTRSDSEQSFNSTAATTRSMPDVEDSLFDETSSANSSNSTDPALANRSFGEDERAGTSDSSMPNSTDTTAMSSPSADSTAMASDRAQLASYESRDISTNSNTSFPLPYRNFSPVQVVDTGSGDSETDVTSNTYSATDASGNAQVNLDDDSIGNI